MREVETGPGFCIEVKLNGGLGETVGGTLRAAAAEAEEVDVTGAEETGGTSTEEAVAVELAGSGSLGSRADAGVTV